MLFNSAKNPFKKIITLSVKARWVTVGQPLGAVNPLKPTCRAKVFNPWDNTSAPITNSTGDKGSPCHKPLQDLKNPCDTPLMIIENQTFDTNRHTMSINLSPKPNFRKTPMICTQDIRSYALPTSNFSATSPPWDLLPPPVISSWASQ